MDPAHHVDAADFRGPAVRIWLRRYQNSPEPR